MTLRQSPVASKELPLQARRDLLLARIHAARGETAELAHCLADDIRSTQRAHGYIRSGFSLLKSSLVAAGVIWSFKATAHAGPARRFLTVAVSVLSALRTLRALGKAGAFFTTFSTTSQKQS